MKLIRTETRGYFDAFETAAEENVGEININFFFFLSTGHFQEFKTFLTIPEHVLQTLKRQCVRNVICREPIGIKLHKSYDTIFGESNSQSVRLRIEHLVSEKEREI